MTKMEKVIHEFNEDELFEQLDEKLRANLGLTNPIRCAKVNLHERATHDTTNN